MPTVAKTELSKSNSSIPPSSSARNKDAIGGTIRNASGILSGFTDVDQSPDPDSYVRYLAHANTEFQSAKSDLHQLLGSRTGDHILDIGCGLGFDSMAMAQLVGKTGRVVGVDNSLTMIREAKKQAAESDLPAIFHIGDIHHLHYQSCTFDACFIASTLMHVRDPLSALSEAIRVLKPGGRLVTFECDWETLVIGFDNPKLERRLVTLLRRAIRNPGIGHQLPVCFNKFDLRDIGVAAWPLTLSEYDFADQIWRIRNTLARAVNAQTMTTSEFAKLDNALRNASKEGRFFGAATAFAVCGTKHYCQ